MEEIAFTSSLSITRIEFRSCHFFHGLAAFARLLMGSILFITVRDGDSGKRITLTHAGEQSGCVEQ